jgi:hypothetical protein
MGTLADVGEFLGHPLDLRALAADDQAGTGGVEGHADAVPSALDDDAGKGGELQARAHVAADLEVLVELLGVILAGGEPLGTPVFVNGEAETDGVDFLAHDEVR